MDRFTRGYALGAPGTAIRAQVLEEPRWSARDWNVLVSEGERLTRADFSSAESICLVVDSRGKRVTTFSGELNNKSKTASMDERKAFMQIT